VRLGYGYQGEEAEEEKLILPFRFEVIMSTG
jgi:hypothetical protein